MPEEKTTFSSFVKQIEEISYEKINIGPYYHSLKLEKLYMLFFEMSIIIPMILILYSLL